MAQLVKNPPKKKKKKESSCNEGDLGSIPGLGRSPGEGKRLLTPVFWPREFNGLYSPWSLKESDTTEQLSLSHENCDQGFLGDFMFKYFKSISSLY